RRRARNPRTTTPSTPGRNAEATRFGMAARWIHSFRGAAGAIVAAAPAASGAQDRRGHSARVRNIVPWIHGTTARASVAALSTIGTGARGTSAARSWNAAG